MSTSTAFTSPPVVVNARCLHRPVTGVERYAAEVIARLDHGVRTIAPSRSLDGVRGHLWEQMVLPSRLARGTMLWSPANTGPLAVARQVVTIHDVSPIDHPEWFTHSFAAWYRTVLPRLAHRVRRVITDSGFSRRRILERFGLPEERVEQVSCGVGPRFAPASGDAVAEMRRRFALSHPYVLSVGSLQPRKNLRRLFDAWDQVAPDRGDTELVIVGAHRAHFRSGVPAPPSATRLLGTVADEVLPALYSGAVCTVAPSVYEGFGLTALEGMACGSPVISAAGTAADEVTGGASLAVDPSSAEAIAEGIRRLLLDPLFARTLAEAGRERARAFTWDHTAREVTRILDEAGRD